MKSCPLTQSSASDPIHNMRGIIKTVMMIVSKMRMAGNLYTSVRAAPKPIMINAQDPGPVHTAKDHLLVSYLSVAKLMRLAISLLILYAKGSRVILTK